VDAARTQCRHVRDRCGVLPHLGVHCGGEDDRTARGQQSGRQQVVCATHDRSRHQISGCRRDDDQIGFLSETDMRNLRDVVEDAGVNRVAGECFERRAADELQSGFGRNHADVMTALGEAADDRARLVRGDTPTDTDDNALTYRCGRVGHSPDTRTRFGCGRCGAHSPSVCSRRSAWISRNAMDSGFSCRPGSTRGPTYSRMPSPSWL